MAWTTMVKAIVYAIRKRWPINDDTGFLIIFREQMVHAARCSTADCSRDGIRLESCGQASYAHLEAGYAQLKSGAN